MVRRNDVCRQTRLHEHGARNDQPMFRHLTNCEPFNQLVQFYRLADIDKMNCYVHLDAHIFTAVLENYEILDFNSDWSQLCFPEAYYIKLNKPKRGGGGVHYVFLEIVFLDFPKILLGHVPIFAQMC